MRIREPGIYQIRNIIKEDAYVGSTVDFHERFAEHRRDYFCERTWKAV